MTILEYKFLKSYGKSWPKFEQVTKKVQTLGRWNSQLLMNNSLLYFCFLLAHKSILAAWAKREQKYQKWCIHRKIRVLMYTILFTHRYSTVNDPKEQTPNFASILYCPFHACCLCTWCIVQIVHPCTARAGGPILLQSKYNIRNI